MGATGQLSQEIKKQSNGASHLSSPSPSAMPNPSFRFKSVHESSSESSLVVMKSTSRSESRNVDLSISEQYTSSSSKSSVSMASLSLETSACTVESGSGQKTKTKDTLPIGIPKPKSKDGGKSSKPNAGPKKAGPLPVDSKQSSHQKGWRISGQSGTMSSSSAGSFDVPDSSGVSCAPGVDGVEASPPSGCSSHPRSWPESSNLAAPAIYVTGPPDKVTNGGGSAYGGNSSRTSHFNEHLSLEEATQCIEVRILTVLFTDSYCFQFSK